MDGPAQPWTVADFAERSGVPATTLRYWDDIGLLPAHRLDNGHRRYGPGDLPRLELLRMCQELGATTEEIRLVLDAQDPAERAAYARRTLPLIQQRIGTLQSAALVLEHVADCRHQDAATCGAWLRTLLAPAPG
ncbi:MAG: MerR family transcriptional regulator [Kineosporiaceae bacterium]|nr:MerR family transcriptional regulator [Kineosporiaceae bacterium]